MVGRNVNFIYEIETPFGYLPMGYKHTDIPLIFDYINENDSVSHGGSPLIYFGYTSSTSLFDKLSDGSNIYSSFDIGDGSLNRKLISDINESDIANLINVFAITPTHNQTIIQKILSENIEDYFTKKSKEFLRKYKNFKIVFVDDKEGGFDYPSSFFDKLNRVKKKLKLTDNQLVFITNTSNIDSIYNEYIEKHKLKSFMKCVPLHFYIYDDAGSCIIDYFSKSESEKDSVNYDGIDYTIPYEIEMDKKRDNYYLCMNRNSERIHRTYLVSDLVRSNLFDKGLVSLYQSDAVDKECRTNKILKETIGDKYPFVIDYDDKDFVANMHNYFNTKDSWMDSYFSIVNETTVSNRHIFITEKCVRPMIYFHPFIIYGNPFLLKHLRELGFETFPEFFDESYDEEIDKVKRRKLIVSNVKRLCDKPLDEIHEMYQSVIPKLIHNRRLLVDMTFSNKKFNTFLEAIVDED